ncbi:LOB domain-containing protein [Actinidia chinensis var. chinensis]|uniref:LOB domain-containing protein n=1 Tax=Actinidia chinensis var. chinensis TaxID=1590841 RepID=A0A2R6RS39_ACTCC|nr:LOB domain-containing protein [Actinidia chinensis var. chinensis]
MENRVVEEKGGMNLNLNMIDRRPCAACKILRRRCAEKCILAPYFPPTDTLKFTIAHRHFGASNIIKFLQDLPESLREDAVSSMVYEANARLKDPVYGCAGTIYHLQNQVSELQAELAKTQAQLISRRCEKADLQALVYPTFMSQQQQQQQQQQHVPFDHSLDFALDDSKFGMLGSLSGVEANLEEISEFW